MPGQEEKTGCAGHLHIVTQIGWFFCRVSESLGHKLTDFPWKSGTVNFDLVLLRSSCPKGILPPYQVIYLGFVLSGHGGYVSASQTASYLGLLYVK